MRPAESPCKLTESTHSQNHTLFNCAKTFSSFTLPSLPTPQLSPSQPGSQPTFFKLRRRNINVTCSASVVDGSGYEGRTVRCAVTLEKGKLDLTQKQSRSSPEYVDFIGSVALG
ncbi:hypothetical protein Patl1_37633 [Pistacia atlantica]|nr:hypothetical protein Patl1_37633 [Pistacia atlantica]